MATKEAQREYQRRWMARRRAEWFEANGPCVDCGTWENLDLDHEVAATRVTHRVWSWSAERREKELAKCVARCEPCHIAKTGAQHEYASGEAHGRARATSKQVQEIHRRVADGESQAAVARSMGYSRGYVNDIIRGKSRRFGV